MERKTTVGIHAHEYVISAEGSYYIAEAWGETEEILNLGIELYEEANNQMTDEAGYDFATTPFFPYVPQAPAGSFSKLILISDDNET